MFPTFDIVKELCKKQGISINTLEERVGFSRNSLYSWRNSSPKPEKLSVIADYFNVSTDYLLGRTDNPAIASNKNNDLITSQEQQALVMFRKETANMTDMEKERFNNALSGLMQTARSLIQDDSLWK
ncbi:TPA: helix-turn-helix transcriptional regulator [Streptococcus agalactiae]|nr:helix-turn-helix transcriptional regulator [Streptococcus agalactiae]HEO6910349.1 helix-turn-helix transcriptional regulator [Streptococcus agalactiae]